MSDVLRNYFKEINEAILWRPDSGELGNGPVFFAFCFPAELLFDSHSLTPQGMAQCQLESCQSIQKSEMSMWVPQTIFAVGNVDLKKKKKLICGFSFQYAFFLLSYPFLTVPDFYLDIPVFPGKLAPLPPSRTGNGSWSSCKLQVQECDLDSVYPILFGTVMGFRPEYSF